MASVWYIGSSGSKTITAEDWSGVGVTGPTVRWNSVNGFSLDKAQFNPGQLLVLMGEADFWLDAPDGARVWSQVPGSFNVPGGNGAGSSGAGSSAINQMLDILAQGQSAVGAAAGSASAAQGSATAAAGSASTANTRATAANTSANAASSSATASANSATAAGTSATNAATSKTGADTAKTAAETAKTASETAKTASETARTAAQTARTGAETARTGAETARTGAEAARDAANAMIVPDGAVTNAKVASNAAIAITKIASLQAALDSKPTNWNGDLAGLSLHMSSESSQSVVIPYYMNDIAYNDLRGGASRYYKDGVLTLSTDLSRLFEPTTAAVSFDSTAGVVHVIEIDLCKGFTYGTKIGWAVHESFRPTYMKVEFMKLGSSTWLPGFEESNIVNGERNFFASPANATGINRLKFTFSDPAHPSNLRLGQLYVVNYASDLGAAPFFTRNGGDLYGHALSMAGDPTDNRHLSRKQYVDTLVAKRVLGQRNGVEANTKIDVLTEAQYAALAVKDPSTLYLTT